MTNSVKEWVLKASQLKEPIAEIAGRAHELPAKINWLLLGSALQQGINLAELGNFLVELQKEIDDVANLPAPSENLILNVISKCHLKDWSLSGQVAGIIWSVGRFARVRENRLDLWIKNKPPTDIWRECGEIFYMGKTSPVRMKVLGFLFRCRLTPAPLPITAGARRWLIQTKNYDAELNPKEKLSAVNLLYKNFYPKNPALACHALQFFKEPVNKGIYYCQKIFPCKLCPVCEYCARFS